MMNTSSKNIDEHSEKIQGFTKIGILKCKFDWTIDNFSTCCPETGTRISSPSFFSPDNDSIKWHLSLFPKGKIGRSEDYLSLYLVLEKDEVNIYVRISFCILDNKKQEVYKNGGNIQYTKSMSYGILKFITQDFLKNEANNLLPDDKLTIRCYLKAGIGIVNDESVNQSVCNDLKILLDKKELTDITLIANGKTLYAHRAILAARSPVFLAMLKHDMKEKIENKIEIVDFDWKVLNEMLQYIYTGEIKNIEKHAFDLFKIADKYELAELKVRCEEYFCDCLSIVNVIKIFELADCYNCFKLKDQVIDFVVINKKKVIESSEFKLLQTSKPHLLNDLLVKVIQKL